MGEQKAARKLKSSRTFWWVVAGVLLIGSTMVLLLAGPTDPRARPGLSSEVGGGPSGGLEKVDPATGTTPEQPER